MDQTFCCDVCHREVPFVEYCRDEAIFAAGWAICVGCEPDLRQRLMQRSVGQQVHTFQIQQHIAPPLETQGMQRSCLHEEGWTFPHIPEHAYQPAKKYRGCIDTYTASYMRWQNKSHVLAWLDSFDRQDALRPIFLDTETTGTGCFSEIIELCLVDEHGQTLFCSLINPTTAIEPMASAVHGLTHKEVKDAPRYSEVYEEIMNCLHDRIVIAYNASFDIRLLKQTTECYDLLFPAFHTGCLMYAYSKYREQYVVQSNGRRRCKTHRLEEVMRYEQLDVPPSHRAEQDTQCVYRLFQAMKTQRQPL